MNGWQTVDCKPEAAGRSVRPLESSVCAAMRMRYDVYSRYTWLGRVIRILDRRRVDGRRPVRQPAACSRASSSCLLPAVLMQRLPLSPVVTTPRRSSLSETRRRVGRRRQLKPSRLMHSARGLAEPPRGEWRSPPFSQLVFVHNGESSPRCMGVSGWARWKRHLHDSLQWKSCRLRWPEGCLSGKPCIAIAMTSPKCRE